MTRTVLVNGFWGQNVGNAFFNLGGEQLLREVTGRSPILIQDAPAYWTLHRKRSGNYARWWNSIVRLEDVDLLVLQGPVLTEYVGEIWDPVLDALRSKGTDVALLGVGLFRYSADEVKAANAFLRRHQPRFIVTRDLSTAERIDVPAVAVHAGLDSVAWTSRLPSIPSFDLTGVALTFDHMREPDVALTQLAEGMDTDLGRLTWTPRDVAGERPREPGARVVLGRALDRWRWRSTQLESGGVEVVRPYHRTNPHLAPVVYARPNAIASDEPYTYLGVYRSVDATLTDRVHAAAATLVGGHPAAYFGRSGRGGLLDSLATQIGELRGARMYGPCAELETRMLRQEQFVASHL